MTPDPFAAALTADATSVPCAPVIVAGPFRIFVCAARSGSDVSTKSSTMPTVTPGAGGGTVGATTAPRAHPAGAESGTLCAMERDVGLGVDEVVPAAERGGEAARAVAGDVNAPSEAERAGAEVLGDLRDARARPRADKPAPGLDRRGARPAAGSFIGRTAYSVPSARTPASRTPRIRPRRPPVPSACALVSSHGSVLRVAQP